jgi:hypothetical protein
VNANPIQRLWGRASACLVVSAVAFVFGGALVFGAIHESYSLEPRGWLANGLIVLGVGVFVLGATTWVRAFGLVAQQVRDRRGAA